MRSGTIGTLYLQNHGNIKSDIWANMTIINPCKSVHNRDKWYQSSFKNFQSIIQQHDKLFKPNEKETLWAQLVVWRVRLDRVDRGGETRSCHLVLWFKNHEYSTLTWKDWSYYQSISSEFRYDFKKVLGTQNRLTHGLPSTHCFLRLNLIKEIFNIVFYTHTHTNMHLTINMASNIPKPNIHLSYLSTKPSIHLSWRLFQGNNKSW